jgi:hypothetical protein
VADFPDGLHQSDVAHQAYADVVQPDHNAMLAA